MASIVELEQDRMGGFAGVGLQWALLGGDFHHISEYFHLASKRERPRGKCPVCDDDVAMRLGMVREHHFCHLNKGDCPTTNPETALHLNAKLAIKRQLEQAGTHLAIQRLCTSPLRSRRDTCRSSDTTEWLRDWTEVRLEHRVDQVIPDLVVLKDGDGVGLIEVCATNAVDYPKLLRLERKGIPWVEVQARLFERDDKGNEKWNALLPLPVMRVGESLRFTCGACQEAETATRKGFQEVVAALSDRAKRTRVLTFQVECSPRKIAEHFVFDRWRHLVSGSISASDVQRWIRQNFWVPDVDGCAAERVSWAEWDEVTVDPGLIGCFAQLGLKQKGELRALVYVTKERTEHARMVRVDAAHAPVAWIILSEGALFSIHMGLPPRTLASSEARPCVTCRKRLAEFSQTMAAKVMENDRIVKIRSVAFERQGIEYRGWMAMVVDTRGGSESQTRLVVLPSPSPDFGSPFPSAPFTLWTFPGGPSKDHNDEVKAQSSKWLTSVRDRGYHLRKKGDWEDYQLQDFRPSETPEEWLKNQEDWVLKHRGTRHKVVRGPEVELGPK